jgi:hypothetical protein
VGDHAGARFLIVWRDSVAAGDDADAPHEWILAVGPDATVSEVVERVLRAAPGYLASIGGGKATWIIETDRPIAVVAQQWEEPRYLVPAGAPVWSVVSPAARPHLQARYWCQVEPERVVEALRSGEPLPDRYSG